MGPYIGRCAPLQIMSNQLNLPQMDSNQVVETSRKINGNQMHLSLISSLIAKGLNTYLDKVFQFYKFAKMSKNLSLWGTASRLMRIFYFKICLKNKAVT